MNTNLPNTPEEIIEYLVRTGVDKGSIASLAKDLQQSQGANAPSLRTEEELSKFKGNSPAIQQLKSKVRKLARNSMQEPVLILGETGTGKELIARALHGDRTGYFIPINCTSLPDELIESELFGYEPGAFTGANVKGRIGKYEAADKGTLFLDEIGDMPLNMQSKLLRVLQDGKISKLGSNQETPFNVRIVCATNRSVAELTNTMHFREDLLWRIGIFKLVIPPIRERLEDIAAIVEGIDTKGKFPKEYKWSGAGLLKGNVREIQTIVKRYLILGEI